MRFETIEAIFQALQARGVRYVVVGGVAVNAHGYQRLTHDLDLVVDLRPENVRLALDVLADLGFRPVLPVPADAFADAEARERWHRDRNMEVFSLASDQARLTIDLFVREPFAFDAEWASALRVELSPGLSVPFVALDTLIRMKERAGRPRDRDDVEHLEWIRRRKGPHA